MPSWARERFWNQETAWAVASNVAAIGGAILVRRGLEVAWERARGTPPPKNPDEPGVRWVEALLYMGAVGVAAGVGRLLARRGATAGWRRAVGGTPPGLRRVAERRYLAAGR